MAREWLIRWSSYTTSGVTRLALLLVLRTLPAPNQNALQKADELYNTGRYDEARVELRRVWLCLKSREFLFFCWTRSVPPATAGGTDRVQQTILTFDPANQEVLALRKISR